MGWVIKTPLDVRKEIEKMSKYRFWDKERERSNHAAAIAASGAALVGGRPLCPMRHQTMAWSGPPHDPIRAYICLDCHAAASEPEIKSLGFTFEEIPDWEIHKIMDEDLKRQALGNSRSFSMYR